MRRRRGILIMGRGDECPCRVDLQVPRHHRCLSGCGSRCAPSATATSPPAGRRPRAAAGTGALPRDLCGRLLQPAASRPSPDDRSRTRTWSTSRTGCPCASGCARRRTDGPVVHPGHTALLDHRQTLDLRRRHAARARCATGRRRPACSSVGADPRWCTWRTLIWRCCGPSSPPRAGPARSRSSPRSTATVTNGGVAPLPAP